MPTEAHAASLNPSAGNQSVQRKCSCGKTSGQGCGCDKRKKRLSLKRYHASSQSPAEAAPIVDEVLRSSGQPLDSATRAFMEPRFGYDFGDVRVHTNSLAARSTSEVSALAFTVGNHIAFGSDQYAPGTSRGNRLLAHELAHVVQQGGAVRRTTQSEGSQPLTLAGSQASNVIQRAGDPTLPDGSQSWSSGGHGPVVRYRQNRHHRTPHCSTHHVRSCLDCGGRERRYPRARLRQHVRRSRSELDAVV